MKLIVFKATGEVREPNRGEWYINGDGDYRLAASNYKVAWPICERIEIEIPEGATEANVAFYSESHVYNKFLIHLSRPKVKKWVWQCEVRPSIKWKTTEHHTEEEIKTAYSIGTSCSMFTKVEGSEVEVEE